MSENIPTASHPATFTHITMTRKAFRSRIAELGGRRGIRGLVLRGHYMHVEYLSSPAGLLVLAHRPYSGQVDGIHPVGLSEHVDSPRNIIEPFFGSDSGYAVHYIGRKYQGGLVLAAFGRMIDPGDPEAIGFIVEHGELVLELFNLSSGPVVAVIESNEKVHLIEAASVTCEIREAA